MMNAAIVDVMQNRGHTLPSAHHSASLMQELAADVQQETSFENFGIPFCMTVEAEALGSAIDFGTLSCEPKIDNEPFSSVTEVEFFPINTIAGSPRAAAMAQAAAHLAQRHPDTPVIGSITGPISTAASLVDPMTFLKELRRNQQQAHKVIDYVTSQLIAYAELLIASGVPVISIADPTATGEILGPRLFEQYALVYLNKLVDAIHDTDTPVIVHICGNIGSVKQQLAQLHGNALSVDAMVNLASLKNQYAHLTTMGNLSTYLLEFGEQDAVYKRAKSLVQDKINIIAPACGLSTSTPLANIQAFTTAVKE
jgi:[methyl-Co(III) methanol-specific corrinoid protein]:coenzyme M methyltransferase